MPQVSKLLIGGLDERKPEKPNGMNYSMDRSLDELLDGFYNGIQAIPVD